MRPIAAALLQRRRYGDQGLSYGHDHGSTAVKCCSCDASNRLLLAPFASQRPLDVLFDYKIDLSGREA